MSESRDARMVRRLAEHHERAREVDRRSGESDDEYRERLYAIAAGIKRELKQSRVR